MVFGTGAAGVSLSGGGLVAEVSVAADAVSALQNLGFKPAVAAQAVAQAIEELGEGGELGALVRVALKKAAG